ncbi:MAG TPA: hypothetical protein V6C52_11720, partial [Coleofasciculaceae cyanobacterium]
GKIQIESSLPEHNQSTMDAALAQLNDSFAAQLDEINFSLGADQMKIEISPDGKNAALKAVLNGRDVIVNRVGQPRIPIFNLLRQGIGAIITAFGAMGRRKVS